jgi:hypothetical protein
LRQHLGLREQVHVADAEGVPFVRAVEAFEHAAVLRGGGQVADLVRVGLEVVQFLRFLRLPVGRLVRRQPPFVEELLPHLRRRHFKHVRHMLAMRAVRQVVAHIDVTGVAHRTHQVVAFVQAPAQAEEMLGCSAGAALREAAAVSAANRTGRRGKRFMSVRALSGAGCAPPRLAATPFRFRAAAPRSLATGVRPSTGAGTFPAPAGLLPRRPAPLA